VGLEATCKVRHGNRAAEGKALLETNELIFRGNFRLVIPLKQVESAEATRGELYVKFPDGTAVFELGPQAEKWALKIRYPRSRIDKLGVKPDSRVTVVGVQDADFHKELTARASDISDGKPRKDSDFIFFAAEDKDDLDKLVRLQRSLRSNGAVWVIYPKGRKDITENDVRAVGKKAGLVDVKVVGFSDTHSALKLVIPVAARKGA
jgi:DUF3052 family protein